MMVLEGEVDALQGAALDDLLSGAKGRYLMGELVGRDDAPPCSLVELIHAWKFIYIIIYIAVKDISV